MNFRKVLIAFSVLLVIVRSIVLMKNKEYRLFPFWYFLFFVGALGAARGVRRYLETDVTLLPGGKGSGHAWYQDIGMGLVLSTMAIVGCVAYIELKKSSRREH